MDNSALIKEIIECRDFANDYMDESGGLMTRDKRANDLWHTIYSELSAGKPGLLGAMLGRAEQSQCVSHACMRFSIGSISASPISRQRWRFGNTPRARPYTFSATLWVILWRMSF